MNFDAPKVVYEYIELLGLCPIEYCVDQHKLIKLLKRVFSNEKLIWNEEQIDKYFSYQKYFPFDLLLWEKLCFVMHNCVFREDGHPRFPDLFMYVGRGSGKNGYLAFEDFCLLTKTNGIERYDIDICATNEEQAKTTFNDIYEVLENPKFTRKFKKHFYWNKEYIVCKDTKSILKFRTNNASGKDGLRSGKVDFDEVHAYKEWKNIDVFTTGLGKKPHPRRTYLSSDGDERDGPLDELKAEADQILNEVTDDDGLFPFICRIENENDVHNELNWFHANPSLKYFPDLLEEIRKEYKKFKKKPNENLGFLVKRMNYPKQRKDIAATTWDNILKTNREIPNLEGLSCICCVDFTKINDMASCGFIFKVDGDIVFIQKNWFCTNSADKDRIKAPLDKWNNHDVYGIKLLEIVNDVEISPYLITNFIVEFGSKFNIIKYTVDNFRFALLARAFAEIGIDATNKDKVKMVRPSDIQKIVPVIDSYFDNGKINVGDNPMFRWAANNTKKVNAIRGNEEYAKIEPKSRKTDPFMSFVNGMCCIEEIHEYKDIPEFKVYTY